MQIIYNPPIFGSDVINFTTPNANIDLVKGIKYNITAVSYNWLLENNPEFAECVDTAVIVAIAEQATPKEPSKTPPATPPANQTPATPPASQTPVTPIVDANAAALGDILNQQTTTKKAK